MLSSAVQAAVALALVPAGIGAVPERASAAVAAGRAHVSSNILWVVAGAGVANRMSMVVETGGQVYLEDNAAEIRLDPDRAGGCRQRDAWSVVCPATIDMVDINLFDRNDYFGNYTTIHNNVYGGAGDDELWGWVGTDYFSGGDGDDELYGLSAEDRLYGGAGADLLEGHRGADALFGGDGDDILRGNEEDDELYGDSGNNDVYGGRGNDLLFTSGSDQAWGDEGDDLLVHFRHNNTSDYHGGAGSDTIAYDHADATIGFNVALNDVADDGPRWDLYIPHNVHSDIEHVTGSGYDDWIIGSDLANTVTGGAGNDIIEGRGGDDILDAQQGAAQRVSGGAGSDRCAGDGLIPDATCERVG
ncbi:calcium-binding protein [Actinoplanes sp. NPDC026670]|uniref:calcium-binding protein n=1 Tax=Actinoplanes sp. NPDC026670 TaxID=3154700 RepID=UPI00340A79AA